MLLFKALKTFKQRLGILALTQRCSIFRQFKQPRQLCQQLKAQFVDRVLDHDSSNINLLVRSFGFKYGVPVDADFVFDLRCLPNPHWNPELRTLSGLDQPVMDYLQEQPIVNEMFEDISSILNRWVPRFEDNARVYMTVAIGCTGGQHRSVYMAQRLAEYLSREHSNVLVRHRELNRG